MNISLLEKLTQTYGPSGYEKPIRDLILSEIKDSIDEYSIDALGNLICRKGSKKDGGKRVMISAHMDEIGLMVSHVDENGFASVAGLGGIYPRNCIATRVNFANGTKGMIFSQGQRNEKSTTMDKLFVDVGATSRENCPVKVGDTCTFEGPFVDTGERFLSKTLDNRVGCFIAIEALKKVLKDSPNEVWFVFSVQEEVGARGAQVAAYTIDPDLGIAIDVTLGNDSPGILEQAPVLGAGPCIKAKDASVIGNPRVNNALIKAAERAGVPYQIEVLRVAGTDAGTIQVARNGVPSSALSVACRYVHSPSEMVDKKDVENAIALLAEFCNKAID